tara:strand:- start:229 stop:948 length:720 start_codon:yes stop_codon:yes gene_type:complete
MDSIIFQGNVIGMLLFIIPALVLFLFVINGLEDRLVERKLYLACGIGVVVGTLAEFVMYIGGTDLHTDAGYAAMILVSPFIAIMFLYRGVYLKTFRNEPAAPHYSAGFGLFFGGALEFWKLLVAESRFSNMSSGDILLISMFGFGAVLFFGGAGMWLAYAIRNDNGTRIAGRLTFLYLFLQYLYAGGLEHVHYGLHNLYLVIASLIAFIVVSGALFHQGYLRLPKISEINIEDGESKVS